MFSFVKSLFVASFPHDTSSSDTDTASDEVHETSQKLQRPSVSQNTETSLSSDSGSQGSQVERIVDSLAPHGNTLTQPTSGLTQHATKKSNHDTLEEADCLSAQSTCFQGSLYSVDGLQFECLLQDCEAILSDLTLVFQPASSSATGRNSSLTIKLAQVTALRQHLVNAFQFIVRTPQGDGGTEYGFQLSTIQSALNFRVSLYGALVRMTTPVFDIECALAEYNTKEREFIILSKSATAKILKSPTGRDYYFTLASGESSSSESLVIDPYYYFVDYLSKDIQIWPSPATNQITFWGLHYRKLTVTKTMFMLEINPATVGEASTNLFFEKMAVVLQDRSFLRSGKQAEQKYKYEDSDILMEDDGFDVGQVPDPSTQLEWKGGRRSTTGHHRSSFFDAESGKSDDSDDGTDEVEELYNPGVYPVYSSNASPDTLVHRFMEVGTDRTFVCRGDLPDASAPYFGCPPLGSSRLQMKVYKNEQGDGEDVLASVGIIDGKKFAYKGKAFVPAKGLLHQKEKKLLLVPENDKSGQVFMMDLEAEAVVQKWDADDTAISTMFPTFKKGQASLDPTFLCANSRQLFLMDTRVQEKSAKTTAYSYTTNPQLSIGTTDSEGHILVGSRLGELRLFDGTANASGNFKRAKTLLQTIKEPITAVDVNNNGSWILATTKTFLVVFPTRLAGTTKTGFETALGKHKPAPRYLMLTADDMVKYQITDINFAPAKFDAKEESIVTSTGNMAVVWDFGTVKRGKPFYSIRFAEDSIKDVQITSDASNVVVAYPTAIGLFGTEKRRVDL